MTTASIQTAEQGALTGSYEIDAGHSRIGFAAKHAMVANVRGQFTEYKGEVYLDEAEPANSRVSLEIDTASVDTRNEQRDAHLRSEDFFDTERFPKIQFTSTKVERVEDDIYELTGDLTIREVTQPVLVVFELTGTATDPWGNFRAGFEGRATVNRRDWGLGWNVALDKGGVLVGEKIKLEFDIAAVKQV